LPQTRLSGALVHSELENPARAMEFVARMAPALLKRNPDLAKPRRS
jgi:hypothetical protein